MEPDVQNVANRWIELMLSNSVSVKFFLTSADPDRFAGYLSRGAYRKLYCLPPAYHCINSWVLLDVQNRLCLPFYLISINRNFIGGSLPRTEVLGFNLSIVKYQQFFEEYDQRFHPAFLPVNENIPPEERKKRIPIVERAEAVLFERVTRRDAAAKQGKIPGPGELPQLNPDDLRYLSDKQLELYREFFSDHATGAFNFKQIQTAFEMFENGELQGNKYEGNLQPDSASDFIFAEFALHAIENGIDPDVWLELLKTFVKTQEIFIRVYRPDGIPNPTLDDYTYTNFKYDRQVTEAGKAMLREKYDHMTKEELERAYGDNLLQAQHFMKRGPS